jgi:hypothetical protein
MEIHMSTGNFEFGAFDRSIQSAAKQTNAFVTTLVAIAVIATTLKHWFPDNWGGEQ